MDTPIKSLTEHGNTIEIYYDHDAESPRMAQENLGTILYRGGRYILGDKKASDIEMRLKAENPNFVTLPVYAYVHGGVALNTTGFSCPWDSGQSGIICVHRDRILQWFGRKKLTKKLRENVKEILKNEIEEFSKYINGEVYGYIVKNRNGQVLESCWGFYDLEDCLNEAKGAACVNSLQVA